MVVTGEASRALWLGGSVLAALIVAGVITRGQRFCIELADGTEVDLGIGEIIERMSDAIA